jgi:hypothetical protein
MSIATAHCQIPGGGSIAALGHNPQLKPAAKSIETLAVHLFEYTQSQSGWMIG